MLKLFTRTLLAASLLLLAFAVPSALAANHSHSATSHAARHRGAHRGTAAGKAHHGKAGKARRASKTVRLVALQGSTTPSVTPLLGDTALESQSDSVNAGEAEAFRVQANTSALTGVAHIYMDARNSARTLFVGLYSGAGAHPGLLLSSGSISSVQRGAWNAVALAPTALVAGDTYWLAILGERGTLRYRDRRSGPCPSETEAQSLGSLPSMWRTGSVYADCPLSGYVTAGESILGPPTPVEPTPPVVEPKQPVVEPTPPVVEPKQPVVEPTPPVVEPTPPVESTPPPPAPTNTALPTISGTPMEGKVLSATNGSWSGSPTSFKHQWQDCNKSGGTCTNVSGATGSSYTLGSGDTGHMMRVMVTASNEGGSDAVSSAPTTPVAAAPVAPAPPTASFTVNPAAPTVGQSVSFNGTGSSCADSPCTYEWSDDGSATRPATVLWPLGNGETLSFAFKETGTKYVRLTVTDASGQTATVEHNVVVEAETPPPPPTPPAAPANTAVPTVSGTPAEGETLNASNGSWTGSPTSYAHQWQDCNSSGASCANVAGADGSSYTLGSGDVGHTVRVVVNASNEGGSTSASSLATATVAGEAVTTPPPPVEEGNCTVTVSSLSQVNADLSSGAVVCLTGGSYGALTVTAKPASNATLTAAPGAHVTIAGMDIETSDLTVTQLHVEGGGIELWQKGSEGPLRHDVIEHNEVGPTNGYGIGVFSKPATPSENIKIAWNKIHDTSASTEGDALRFDGWKNIEVIGNDIYNIKECPTSCHTDTLQSYQGGTPTSGLLIERNFVHDGTNVQGLAFLKDGDVSNVTIRDNMELRMASNNPVTGIWVDDNSQNLLIERNTYQGTSGSMVAAGGSTANPTATITHNVFDVLNSTGYSLTEDYNIFTGDNEWSFGLGPHDQYKVTPTFMNPAAEDYRLANNPNGIGVDWAPAEMHWGPSA